MEPEAVNDATSRDLKSMNCFIKTAEADQDIIFRAATSTDRAFVESVYFATQRWLIEELFGWRGDDVERTKFAEFYDEQNTERSRARPRSEENHRAEEAMSTLATGRRRWSRRGKEASTALPII
jgi:hypothetical protein